MQKITRLRDQLCETFIDRSELVEGMLLGMLTGHHVLFIGPPGSAKSMLVNEFCSRLSDGKFFSYLMTKYTKPDEIIGSVSLKSLENDEFKRNLTGKTADAHFVFLDEIFNSNSSCANLILTILNERRYHNGSEIVQVPLIMLAGAANELPVEIDNELQAFYDRFLFRYEIEYIKDTTQLCRLFEFAEREVPKTTYTLEELKNWQCEATAVKFPQDIAKRVVSIVVRLREAGVSISDRRLRESRKVLQAHAYLKGRKQVTLEDLGVLGHIFWIRPDDKRIFQDFLPTVKLSVEVQAAELLTEAQKIMSRFRTFDDVTRRMALGGEVTIRLTEIEKCLKELLALAIVPSSVAADALKKVQEIHNLIIKECLTLDAGLV